MLSQAKIELAVLHKLYDFAERNVEAPAPTELTLSLRAVPVSLRRVEVALNELEGRGHAECFPDPRAGAYRWQITREGFGVVDRALRVPTSFIARAATDTSWLATEAAEKAVLKTLSGVVRPVGSDCAAQVETPLSPATTIQINNNYTPTNTQTLSAPGSDDVNARSAKWAGWFGGWGAWVGALIALGTLGWILHEAKVF